MNPENIKFNNNLLAFLVENQKYLDVIACSKGGSDRHINTHRENNIALIEWYKKGLTQREIALKMSIGLGTVNRILRTCEK